MNIELNENEANVLTGLIDIAIKSGGLQVAEAGVALAIKIANAAKTAAQPAPAPAAPTAGDQT